MSRLATQPRPDPTQSRLQETRVRLEKKNSKSQETSWARRGGGDVFFFHFVPLFCQVQQISLWLAPGNRGNELGLEREGLHLRRLILRTSPKDFSVGRGNLDEKEISRP